MKGYILTKLNYKKEDFLDYTIAPERSYDTAFKTELQNITKQHMACRNLISKFKHSPNKINVDIVFENQLLATLSIILSRG